MEPSAQRLRVHYRLVCSPGEPAADKARGVALEQSVELPSGCYPSSFEGRIVGTVERLRPLDERRARVEISYDIETIGHDISQLLNLLFGNVSLQQGILVERVDWPAALLRRLGGPRHGIEGLRELCGVASGPLSCTALKPLGSNPTELAGLAREFALAGIDLIKDDHGLADQPAAPFDERVARCQEAVERANRESGGRALYLPHLTGSGDRLARRARRLVELGCRAVVSCPLIAGIETVGWISRRFALAVIAHPAMAGAYLRSDHGIDAGLLLGDLFRIAGADGVVFPNVGGRFPFDQERCDAIVERLRAPLDPIRRAFPVPAGGIDAARVPEWLERYGPDTILLIGSSLYARGDRVEAGRRLVRSLGR